MTPLVANRIPRLVALAVAAMLCTQAATAPVLAKDPPRPKRAVPAPSPSPSFADIAALQGQFDAAVESRDYELALSYGSRLEPAITQYFGKSSLEHALVLHQIGSALIAKGAYKEAAAKCGQALAVSEPVGSAGNPALKDALECLAESADRGEDAAAAIRWYERLAAMAQANGNQAGIDLLKALSRLVWFYRIQNMHEQAVRLYPRIVALLETLPPERQRGEIDVELIRLADSLKQLGRKKEGLAQLERALAFREQFEGKNATSLVMILIELGEGYIEQKDNERAVAVSLRAVKLLEAEKAFGPDAPFLELPLTSLGLGYLGLSRNDDAIATFERVLASRERQLGRDSAELLRPLRGLTSLYVLAQRYGRAEMTMRRIIALRASQNAAPHELQSDYISLGETLEMLGRYAEAESLLTDFLPRLEADRATKRNELIPILDRLGNLSRNQARFNEAGRYLQRALSIAQSDQPSDPATMTNIFNSFGLLFLDTERKDEARIMFERAYELQRKLVNSDESASLISPLNNRAITTENPIEAKQLLERALRIAESTFGPTSRELAGPLINLAVRQNDLGEFAAAAALLERAVEINTSAFGPNSVELVIPLLDLSYAYRGQKSEKAAETLRQALAICDASLPEYHPLRVSVLDALSSYLTKKHDYEPALRYGRMAVKLVLDHSARELSIDDNGSAKSALDSRIGVFRNLAAALTLSSRTTRETYERNGEEMFEVAQWVSQSTASIAMKQMAVRLSVDNPEIADIVRKRQDALATRTRLQGEFAKAMAGSGADSARLTGELREVENRLLEQTQVLKQRFPNYFNISGLKPSTVKDVQKWLRDDEALVLIWQIKDRVGLVFAISSDDFEWDYTDVERPEDRIKAFRAGLVGEPGTAFDLGRSHELYQETLGKVDGAIRGKANLLVVPAGIWAALPFHLLVTDPPPPQGNGQPAYAEVPWLIKRQAVSVLPSVSSLEIFRTTRHGDPASRPLVGFGNPVFEQPREGRPPRSAPAKQAGGAARPAGKQSASTRAYGEFWKGAEIDRQKLAAALPALPDTEDELTSVAKSFGRDANALYFGAAASETSVKHANLSDFRVVYFATHGLVAGDVKGIGEPALALSLPKVPSELDDGLLTSSEISRLKLNADWVVLSACNTLSGDQPGGEALSGLARAFFYAGAHSLLASHWAVESEAAVRLTTTTFKLLEQNPQMRRSEALRQAMLTVLSSNAQSSAPGYWGPFSLIGE